MEESYKSQEALILQRAAERRVDTLQLQQFFDAKIKEITTKYPDPAYSYLWRLSKVEFLVWERFFPTDPFPGVLEYLPVRDAAAPALPRSKSLADREWTHDKYNPAGPVEPLGGRSRDRRYSDLRRVDQVPRNRMTDHYSPPRQSTQLIGKLSAAVQTRDKLSTPVLTASRGSNAHQRSAQSKIAARDVEYPMPLTCREQLLNGGKLVDRPWPADSKTPPHNVTHYSSSRINLNSNDPVGVTATQQQSTAVLAPVLTQTRTHYPNMAINTTKHDLGKDRARTRQENEPPGDYYLHKEQLMRDRATEGKFLAEMFQYLQKARDEARRKHPNCNRYIRAYLADKQTWDHFWPQEAFLGIEPKLGHTEGCMRRSGTLSLARAPVASPYRTLPRPTLHPEDAISNASRPSNTPKRRNDSMLAHRNIFVSPVPPRLAQSSARGRLSPVAHPAPKIKQEPAATPAKLADVMPPPKMLTTTPRVPVPANPVFQDPDLLWTKFKSAFQVSGSERSKIERHVTTQGQLRLVLDESSGQVITVEELVKRTQYRYALKGKLKRKADDSDDLEKEQAAKRAANCFLDRLAEERAESGL